MKSWLQGLLLGCCVLGGCTPQLFPSHELKDVDRNFDFTRWRTVPSQIQPTKIELGGRIVETQTLGGTITIVTAQLPIVSHPAYGPKQAKSKGDFAITFQGKIDAPFLHPGNRLIVIGTTRGTKMAAVDDVVRSLPLVEAKCVHIWKTGNVDISDYASSGAGYGVLQEETFCRSETK
jgi:starvation-inducible outer membrane lipoprotein